ncbi:PepSY domain-containing protein [Nocardia huaxiensis]|uniref:PepSY domain-containing protein n=1 Tax=Nocardia huaxiensis TaxID=2755382 RepID=A0A7D6VA33_9NOCA|nr:PepSY domain-containing protein [Nocardia huaxiensis]QLY30071.1 PepSY domain-containing protein [Nocardia huaxiensis]UFS96326.1 PepSY domain-containing protein [Nocardia huaxiensis]
MTVHSHRGTRTLRRFAFGAFFAAATATGAAAPVLAAPTVQAAVDEQEAMEAARHALQGATVQSVELEMSSGSPKWEVEVATRTGGEYEVEVDAMNGMILSIEQSA